MRQLIFVSAILFLISGRTTAQCCSGGTGSPIAGGASQGVLSLHQLELNTNFQFIDTDRFFSGSARDTAKYFDRFRSFYQYFRVAYGVSERLTFSVEMGNYLLKEEIGLNNDPARTYSSSGFGDLIIFPRYEVFNRNRFGRSSELTVGFGFKIPLGSYNDSTGNIEPFSGTTYYVTNPQGVQVTSGANDIIVYLFYSRGFPKTDLRVFATALYIGKGWNPLGEKLGDYVSLGLFASKLLTPGLGATLQIRGEWTDAMTVNPNILMYSYPNYDPQATGYKKVFVSPQLNLTLGNITLFAIADIPLYQYVNRTQVGSTYQFTAGLSFRVMKRSSLPDFLQES